MTDPKMSTAKGDGVNIHLTEWAGTGQTLFCVHGLTANSRGWDVVAEGIVPNARVIAMDLRGRGLSDKPAAGYSVDVHVRDIEAILDSLNLDKVVLIGHSLGALIALVFAARYPDRLEKLILADGAGKLEPEETARVFAGIGPALERLGKVFPTFDDYLNLMKAAPFNQPWSKYLETYYKHEVEDVEGGIRSRVRPDSIDEEVDNLGKVDASEYYSRIACPTLILRAPEGMLGGDEILLPERALEKMLKEIPDAECVNIDGANHYTILFHENAQRDRAILDFIK